MSGSRGSGAGTGGGAQPIPAGSRKMVQSLKEIVNCSELEIYAALKECNMDPNEAVNRLLTQDPFHEVKSKREKKKEGKDTTDSRSRGGNNSNRANKIGADRHGGRGGSTSHNSYEPSPLAGKSPYKKDNGSIPHASSSFPVLGTSGSSRIRGSSAGYSNGDFAENKGSLLDTDDAVSSGCIKPTSGYQPTWAGARSMADIVKMGRPHNLRFPEDHASKVPVSGISPVHNVPTSEEWPTIEKPASTKVVSIPEHSVHSEKDLEAVGVTSDTINLHSETEDDEVTEDENIELSGANDVGSDLISNRKIPDGDSRGASLFENDLYSYQNQAHESPHADIADEEIGASVLSVTRNLQQLGVENDDRDSPSEGCQPSVVIPDHLQVQDADCSHLSFGSFGSSMSGAYSSGTIVPMPVKANLEEVHAEANVASVVPLDTRGSEYRVDDSPRNASDGGLFHGVGASAGSYEAPYRVDDSPRNASDGGLFHGVGASAGSYEAPSVSHPEELKQDSVEVAHRNQYPFPSPNPGYAFDDARHLNASLSRTSSPLQNLSPFSAMQSYTNSLPSTLSPANAHPSRESDIHYSPFPVSISTDVKYGNSSLGGSVISMSEALQSADLTSTQPTAHTISGTNVATGPPLPQHLAVHPYSQHSLPFGPYTNMLGYPFLPQSYTYVPSAFQQAFAGNSTYHQSLATVLPQYKNSVSASNLPQSAAIPPGYGGGFGNTTTISGNFPMNAPTATPSAASLNYDDVLASHYKDANNLVSHQQGENSPAMWLQGPNSRTMSAVPANTFYNYQAQNQQSSGFRQGQQQLSQNYGALGYPNMYHSQSGPSTDLHQNPRDGSLGGPQGQPKPSQIWQNSY